MKTGRSAEAPRIAVVKMSALRNRRRRSGVCQMVCMPSSSGRVLVWWLGWAGVVFGTLSRSAEAMMKLVALVVMVSAGPRKCVRVPPRTGPAAWMVQK